jgi:sugar phosphate isomerase/epimerase
MNRRGFLGIALGAAAAGRLAAKQPNLQFPAEPRARLGVASYPFRAFIDSPNNRDRDRTKPGMELKDFPAMVREKFNLRNIEPLDSHFDSNDPAYLRELRAAIDKAGSHVINIPVSVHHSLYDPDQSKRKTGIENAMKWIDAAVLLGSPSVRVHIQGARGVAPDVGRTVESVRPIADYGAGKNILVNLENDDPRTEDAFFLVKVIEQVNNPYLHGLPDFCNSLLKGDEKYNYDAVAAMFRHAYNISHVKDSEVDNGKVFRVDVARTFAIAKQAGYRGFFSMEWEGEGGPYEGTQKLIDASLKHLA